MTQFASPIAVSAQLKPSSSMRRVFSAYVPSMPLSWPGIFEGDFLALHLQENNATGWPTRMTLTADAFFTKAFTLVPGPAGRYDEIPGHRPPVSVS